uniref:Uncharacterized protein LOC114334216 n=1 Tax=Diabrotica virgifera virgifera TaxID=50390 RepID=A0A6P7FZ14_DIAVI
MEDNRGCHSNHVHVDDALKTAAKAFIEDIPKIESHYIRANSKRHYIDGSKTISDIHRDYVQHCKNNNVGFVNYIMFYRIFTQDFYISFFIPKKDTCELCEAYKNYYKSKLNVLNLTIYDLKTHFVESYVWDESQAHRGVNEIATCVFKYLQKNSDGDKPVDVVFYSYNCDGQQKNKFMMAMHLYAFQKYPNIKTITHKYLIKGHTQNESDSVHSQIERQTKRQLRSGPIYTPEGFIGAIKAARKKSEPIYYVNEMCFEYICDWKAAANQMNFVLQKDDEKNTVKMTEIKVFKVVKDEPEALYFKTSYAAKVFKRAVVIKKKSDFTFRLKKAFDIKPGLAERKKQDLLSLLNSSHIPGYYRGFYESL